MLRPTHVSAIYKLLNQDSAGLMIITYQLGLLRAHGHAQHLSLRLAKLACGTVGHRTTSGSENDLLLWVLLRVKLKYIHEIKYSSVHHSIKCYITSPKLDIHY